MPTSAPPVDEGRHGGNPRLGDLVLTSRTISEFFGDSQGDHFGAGQSRKVLQAIAVRGQVLTVTSVSYGVGY